KDVSEFALQNELTGMEFFYDIPSSLGGAIVMNAGTKEGETKEILLKVRYLDLNEFLVKERHRDELQLDYRTSFFQNNPRTIILKAWFCLKSDPHFRIEQKMLKSKERRWEVQPRNFPNCGSVFKRP